MATRIPSRTIPPTIIQPRGKHTASVLFLHGFGATSLDWAFLPSAPSCRALRSETKWIFPQAPMREITMFNGESAPAWFDIKRSASEGRDQEGSEDEEGMLQSIDTIRNLVEQEVAAGIPRERIVLGGFSQGAATTLLYGSNLGKGTGEKESKVGSLVILSGYAPLKWKISKMVADGAKDTSTFWAHGTHDDVLPYKTATRSVKLMRSAGMSSIEFHTYNGMAHSYCDPELNDLGEFLNRRIPPLESSSSAAKL